MAKIAQFTNYLGQQERLQFPDETPDAVMDAAVKRAVGESASKGRQEAGEMAAEGMGRGEKALAGAGAGFREMGEAVGVNALLRKIGADIDRPREQADYEKGLGGWGTAGKLGAEIATTALPAAKAASLAGRGLAVAGRTLTPMGTAAIEGMAAGAMTSPEDQLKGAVTGGAGGAVGQKVLSKVIGAPARGVPQSVAAERLRKQGVELTAGQGADVSTLGGRSYQAIEEGLESFPVLGQKLARQREAAGKTFRERAMEKVLPQGSTLPRPGEGTPAEIAAALRKQAGDVYALGPERYGRLASVEQAVERAGGAGNFTPTMLRKAAKAQSEEMERFARQAERFVPPTEAKGRGTWPAYAALLGGYMLGGPALTAAGAAVIPAMGTKVVQRALRGDFAAQKMVAEALRKHPSFGSKGGGIIGANTGEER